MPEGLLVTVPEPMPAGATDSMKLGISAKVAVTVVSAVGVMTQGPVPLQPPPLQPEKVEPAAAEAVRVCTQMKECDSSSLGGLGPCRIIFG